MMLSAFGISSPQRIQNDSQRPFLNADSQKSVYFSATSESSQESSQAKPSTTWFERMKRKFFYIAPVSNLLGGLFLIAGSLLPNTWNAPFNLTALKKNWVQSDKTVQQPEKLIPLITTPATTPEETIVTLKELFSQLGFGLSLVGMAGGGYNQLRTGFNQKQPSMALGGLSALIAAPVFFFSPSIPVRSALQVALGLFLTGFANKMKNDYQLKPGEARRELDLNPLVSLAALKKTLPDDTPASTLKCLHLWLTHARKTCRFIAEDQWFSVKSVTQETYATLRHPITAVKSLTHQMGVLFQRIRGKTTELPAFLQPSGGQAHLSSLLIYAGGVPLLLLGGEIETVKNACTGLIGLGMIPATQSLFAIGLNEKGPAARSLLVGVPLSILGNVISEPQLGTGIGNLGNATFSYYYGQEALKGDNLKEDKKSTSH